MAIYFGGDNIVWASQAGILQNKTLVLRAQKASLYGWAGGSVIGVLTELHELQGMSDPRRGLASNSSWRWICMDALGGLTQGQLTQRIPTPCPGPTGLTARRVGELEEVYQARLEKNGAEITRHLLLLVHSLVQVGH